MPRTWDRFIQYMNEQPAPQPITAEKRNAAAGALQRKAGFAPAETDQLADDVLLQVKAEISAPPRWQTTTQMIMTVFAILLIVHTLWRLLGVPAPSLIASVIGATIAMLVIRRQGQRPRFANAHEAFGDAGMRLMRAVGQSGSDQSTLRRNAVRAAADWRRLGPPLGANVADRIERTLQLIGPDQTLPLAESAQAEIGAMVRATLVEAAHRATDATEN